MQEASWMLFDDAHSRLISRTRALEEKDAEEERDPVSGGYLFFYEQDTAMAALE